MYTHIYSWETNVWCDLVNGKLFGSYFYDGTLNGKWYNDFIGKLASNYAGWPSTRNKNKFNIPTRWSSNTSTTMFAQLP